MRLVAHGTTPDFYATRLDRTGTRPIAVHLDGWELHGDDPEDTDKDAVRRSSLRASGTRVWTLTWNDVKAALTAANDNLSAGPALPVSSAIRHRALQGAAQMHGAAHPVFDALELGAFDQLMWALRHPAAEPWRALATTTVIAAAGSPERIHLEQINAAIDAVAHGDAPTPAALETGIAALLWETPSGQPVATIVDQASRAVLAVLSCDTREAPDRRA